MIVIRVVNNVYIEVCIVLLFADLHPSERVSDIIYK